MSTETRTLEEMQARVFERGKQPAQPAGDSAAARLIADDQARREKERLQRRADVRTQIKQRGVLEQRMADLAQQLQLLDVKADGLAAAHQERTGPIQEALSSASGSKRAGLLQKLSEANYELEQGLLVVERMRGPLRKQHTTTRNEYASLPTEARLAGADLASPLLRVEQFVAEQRLAAAEGRIERAREWVGTYDSQLQMASSTPTRPVAYGWIEERGKISLDFERIALLSFRLSKWRAELLDAEHERHECMSELQRINKEAIAE